MPYGTRVRVDPRKHQFMLTEFMLSAEANYPYDQMIILMIVAELGWGCPARIDESREDRRQASNTRLFQKHGEESSTKFIPGECATK